MLILYDLNQQGVEVGAFLDGRFYNGVRGGIAFAITGIVEGEPPQRGNMIRNPNNQRNRLYLPLANRGSCGGGATGQTASQQPDRTKGSGTDRTAHKL
jgi:hypothetical protein